MEITGIICEYDPLHSGHKRQLDCIRKLRPDGGIVCLMSGNYVQRGKPAMIDKSFRAQAAILSGADLVLELPVTASLSSAEGFAAEGVRILGGFCHYLSFGSESADEDALMETANALLHPNFPDALSKALEKGLSFPAARQQALEKMGIRKNVVSSPNDILAVEYCKSILSQNLSIKPEPIYRPGNYHDVLPSLQHPSATAVRAKMLSGEDWGAYVPDSAHNLFANAPLHALWAGERAVLGKLRTMQEEDFASLPYGSEGLWRKLMHNCRLQNTLEEIITATKSKRYTRSRLDRMVMCAFLGLTAKDISVAAPYTRVLALNDRGRQILNQARLSQCLPNIGEKQDSPYQNIENRCADLYGLFALADPDHPGSENKRRIYYQR